VVITATTVTALNNSAVIMVNPPFRFLKVTPEQTRTSGGGLVERASEYGFESLIYAKKPNIDFRRCWAIKIKNQTP
jgi:hypothetical protein